MNKHPEPLFQKRTFSPPGRINFGNIFITPPKTFQFDLGVAGNEILTLSALYRSCQFLPLSDRTIYTIWINFLSVIFSQLIAKLDSVKAISGDLETSKFQRGTDPWTQNILASYTPRKLNLLLKNGSRLKCLKIFLHRRHEDMCCDVSRACNILLVWATKGHRGNFSCNLRCNTDIGLCYFKCSGCKVVSVVHILSSSCTFYFKRWIIRNVINNLYREPYL